MPEDLQSEVLRRLDRRDRLPVALALEGTKAALTPSPELHDAQVLVKVQKVKSLKEFLALLCEISSGPKGLQAEELLRLGYRFPWLPEDDKDPAAKAFEAAAADFPDELRSVQVFLRAAKVTSLDEFLFLLGRDATESDDTIPAVRKDLQAEPLLTLGYGMYRLRLNNGIRGAASAFIEFAAPLDRQHFTKSQNAALDGLLCELRRSAAPLGSVLVSDQVTECRLRKHIARTAALSAIDDGMPISVVAERYGIDREYLEHLVIEDRGGAEVRKGESVEIVAKRYGIETPEGQKGLACFGLAVNLQAEMDELIINQSLWQNQRRGNAW